MNASTFHIALMGMVSKHICITHHIGGNMYIWLQFIVPKSSKLKKWNSHEVNEVIFVWHHAENADPWPIPAVPQIESGQWQYYGKNEFLVNCHIQEIPENGADVAHLNALHSPNMFAGSDLRYTRSSWTSCVAAHAWDAK